MNIKFVNLFIKTFGDHSRPIHSISPERSNSALNEYDLDEERMKQYLCVIKTLTLDRQERQLEVLFGLQELFHRLSYPKGDWSIGDS